MKPDNHLYRSRFVSAVLLLSLLAGLSACGAESESDLPVIAARDWLKAANGAYTQIAVARTCGEKVEELKTNRESGLAGYIVISKKLRSTASQNEVDVTLDVSDVAFSVVSQEAEEAIVEASGKAFIIVGEGSPSPVALDERWLMVLEDDEWKWCGISE